MRFSALLVFLVACFLSVSSSAVMADEWLESYVARLSENDHYNSRGVPLRDAASILAQDRANVHRFNLWDGDDEPDTFFTTTARRQMMAAMLERGGISRSVRNSIVKFDVMVQVNVWRGAKGPYVIVDLLP